MTNRLNTADGGTNGATVIGGATGSGDALTGVQIDAVSGAALTYSTAQAKSGSLSYHCVTGTTSANVYAQLALPSNQAQGYTSLYLYATAYPTAGVVFMRVFGGSVNGSIAMTTTGGVQVFNGVGSSLVSAIPGFTMPLGKWVRFELGVLNASTTFGQLEVRIYSSDSESYVPDYTFTSANTINAGTSVGTLRFGCMGATGVDFYLDTIQVSDAGYPGPYSPSDALAVGRFASLG